ncbi:MAG TPA: aminoglycoside phosphotransferase family protein [Ilumatobacteraceae bacterium]
MAHAISNVDLAGASAFLGQRFGVDADVVEYVGEGAWSRCYGFTHNGAELVVRFGDHVEDFERDRLAARFASFDLPIPQVIEIDEALDTWYCVSTRGHGTPLELLDESEWATTVPSVLATLDALRRADITGTKGYGSWDHQGDAPHSTWSDFLLTVIDDPGGTRTSGWKTRLVDAPNGDEVFMRAYENIVDLADAFTGPRCLIHNDLLNRNVLAVNGHITSVFDWGCSMYGDFVYELATIVFWSNWYPAIERSNMLSRSIDHHRDMGLDVANFDERLRCCALHVGAVHIAYNALLGDLATLSWTEERTRHFLVR